MKKIITGIVIGWVLNISFVELQHWEHITLENHALNIGMKRRIKGYKGDQIRKFIERNRTKVFDYINYKPNFWHCRYVFEFKDSCPFTFLKKDLIPADKRPVYTGKYY